MEIGLKPIEIQKLLISKHAEKTVELSEFCPPHTEDVYDWVEKLLNHHSQIWIATLTDILARNNNRIAQQIPKDQ